MDNFRVFASGFIFAEFLMCVSITAAVGLIIIMVWIRHTHLFRSITSSAFIGTAWEWAGTGRDTILLLHWQLHDIFAVYDHFIVRRGHSWGEFADEYFAARSPDVSFFQALKISDHVYQTNWYNFPLGMQKRIPLLLTLNRRPRYLSGYTLFTSSRHYFLEVISSP